MKSKYLISLVFLFIFTGLLLPAQNAYAFGSIAKITGFTGDVTIISGGQTFTLEGVGTVLYESDQIQTRDGNVEVSFNDGAIMRVSSHSNVTIEQKKEKEVKGLWTFKKREVVRRIRTTFGKFWFWSSTSKRKTYLETPTAVCGLRGTALWISFDGKKTWILMTEGTLDDLILIGDYDVWPGPGPPPPPPPTTSTTTTTTTSTTTSTTTTSTTTTTVYGG